MPECDLGWVMDMNAALVQLYQKSERNGGRVPFVVVIRFNPDECDTCRVSLDERIDQIASRINDHITVSTPDPNDPRPCVEYWYYHTKCSSHVHWARQSADAVHVTKVV